MNYSFTKVVSVLNNSAIKYYFADSRANTIVNMHFLILDKNLVIVSLTTLGLSMVTFIRDLRR